MHFIPFIIFIQFSLQLYPTLTQTTRQKLPDYQIPTNSTDSKTKAQKILQLLNQKEGKSRCLCLIFDHIHNSVSGSSLMVLEFCQHKPDNDCVEDDLCFKKPENRPLFKDRDCETCKVRFKINFQNEYVFEFYTCRPDPKWIYRWNNKPDPSWPIFK